MQAQESEWEGDVALVANVGMGTRAERGGSSLAGAEQLEEICHDLKQSIATGLLLSDPEAAGDAGGEVRKRLEMLHQQWEDAAALVAILNHEVAAGVERIDLAELAFGCAEPLRAAHAIDIEIGDGEHGVVSDRVLVRRAVGNLLDNACRATPPGGRVQVRVGSDGRHSFVEVADEGPGFGEIASGTGIGLEVVRSAVWRGGGHLRIDTGPRGGTSVRMSFPALLQVVA